MARMAKELGPDAVDVAVGERIRAARLLRGLSQSDLADAIGVSFQQVQKYERGSNRVSASRLYDLSRILGVAIQEFFEDVPEDRRGEPLGDRPEDLVTSEELAHLGHLRRLPEDQRRVVLSLIDSMRRRSA